MSKHWRFFKKHTAMSFSSFFTYRGGTFAQWFSDLLGIILQPLLIFFIYDISNGIPGWSFYELILFNATGVIAIGIAGTTFMAIIWNIGWRIDNGYFDLMLLQPLKIIPEMILSSFNPWFMADLIIGIILFTIAFIIGEFTVTISGAIIFTYLLLLSGMIYYGISSLILGLSFKYFKAHKFMELFWIMSDLNNYPLDIYKNFIPFLLTFILPISIANYYPASFLLGRLTDTTILLSLTAISITFAIMGTLMLKWGIKNYTSAGG